MAGALTPAPVWNCHNHWPELASRASKLPLPSPVKTRPPAVVIVPPMHMLSVRFCQACRFVRTSIAVTVPHVSPPGGVTNALPSRNVPGSIRSGLPVQICGWWIPQTYMRFVFGLNEDADHSEPPLAPGQMSTGVVLNGVKIPAVG